MQYSLLSFAQVRINIRALAQTGVARKGSSVQRATS
jgi:hypothetical protein